MLKDLNIVAEFLERLDLPLPATRLARKRFKAMVDCGDGELDCSAIMRNIRS